jgi:hypothetical protein
MPACRAIEYRERIAHSPRTGKKVVPMPPMPIGTRLRPRGCIFLLATSGALAAGADLLFYPPFPIGWPIGAYVALLVLPLIARVRERLGGIAVPALCATWGLVPALIYDPGILPVTLTVVGLIILSACVRSGSARTVPEWAVRISAFALLGPFTFFRDFRLLRRLGRGSRTLRPLFRWTLPVVLSLLFVWLFALANPVIEEWVWAALNRAGDFFVSLLRDGRALIWIAAWLLTWALLRFRPPALGKTARPPSSEQPPLIGSEIVTRCLLLFNGVFAVQTALDICYLWYGASLPPGLTYAGYAHRGAYPLLAATLASAAFVLVTFRPGSRTERTPAARRLVALWLAQNLLLAAASVWRLRLYIDAYNLTRFRVAAIIWMALVGVGLFWLLVRIVRARSNDWLMTRCTVSLAAVLYLCAFVNFDSLIALHNVYHCREVIGTGAKLDVAYLKTLGVDALPALRRLATMVGDDRLRTLARAHIDELNTELAHLLGDLRGWTYHRQRLRDE